MNLCTSLIKQMVLWMVYLSLCLANNIFYRGSILCNGRYNTSLQSGQTLTHTALSARPNFLQWYQNIFLNALTFYKPNIPNSTTCWQQFSGSNQKNLRAFNIFCNQLQFYYHHRGVYPEPAEGSLTCAIRVLQLLNL